MHGDKKEPTPARAETNTVVSTTLYVTDTPLKVTTNDIIIINQ